MCVKRGRTSWQRARWGDGAELDVRWSIWGISAFCLLVKLGLAEAGIVVYNVHYFLELVSFLSDDVTIDWWV